MYTIKRAPTFDAWLNSLKDRATQMRLRRRLEKAQLGNLGDTKNIGGEVHEMREHFGPGWRMYYVKRGSLLIVMLGGGEKSTQSADISAAKKLATLLED